MSRTPFFLLLVAVAACEGAPGADGKPGTNGVDGTDGVNGTDGTNGTDGVDGTNGTDGTDGVDGEDLMAEPESLDVTITGVTVSGAPVVTFTVANQDGEPYNGLSSDLLTSSAMRFIIAKLTPGEDGDPDTWQSYINKTEDTSSSTAGPDGVPVEATAIQATTESGGTLTYVGSGTYTYTFATDITAVTSPLAVTYDDTLLHRVAMQLEYPLEDGSELIYNPTYDFVPSGGTAPATRAMVTTSSCNECHGDLAIHGGGRKEVDYCVTCHNPGSSDANSGNSVDFEVMVHKIHMGSELPSVEAGGSYTIWGYMDGEHDYSHVGYPQDQENCLKCHNPDDAETPDAGNYLDQPNMNACGSCHDDIDFADADSHEGGVMTDNATCTVCHTADNITEYHLTENATENNPDLPDGLSEIVYQIDSATVDADGVLTVEFVITQDGTALDVTDLPTDLASSTRAPTFILAFAAPTEGNEDPVDWNNYGAGNGEGQPDTVSILDVNDGDYAGASISYSGGVNTLTFPDAFPEDATMRTVALQGYWNQNVDGTDYARHAISVYMTVDGDDERRQVADAEGCASCHEWFEGHGGNRVYEVQVCAMCHNPDLTSSGRELDITHPEASNSLSYLVHGIHGASVREDPLDFVRNRSGGTRYTFLGSEDQLEEYPDGHLVTYPNDVAACDTCHLEGTYWPESVPTTAAYNTQLIAPDGADTSEVISLRATVPNDSDWVMGATAAACGSCHDGEAALAHIDQNGGAVLWTREEAIAEEPYETCSICHGEGSVAPIDDVHGQ